MFILWRIKMRIIPKFLSNPLEKWADQYMLKNFRRKYLRLKNAIFIGTENAEFDAHLAGNDIFLAVIITLAANNIYNKKAKMKIIPINGSGGNFPMTPRN